jgi:hypothetical protein
MIWVVLKPDVDLGFLPAMIRLNDLRPVKEQLDERYAHGGGWNPTPGFTMQPNHVLHYPEDPPFHPLAMSMHGDETLVFYEHDFLAIIQKDGTFEVARVD